MSEKYIPYREEIAPEYSSSATYKKGDIAYKDGVLKLYTGHSWQDTTIADNVNKEDASSKAALALTNRRVDALYKINEGQTYDWDVDTDEAYSVDVPSGAVADSVKMIGGKTVVMNQQLQDKYGRFTSKWYVGSPRDGDQSVDNNILTQVVQAGYTPTLRLFGLNHIISGHKYYLTIDVKNGINETIEYSLNISGGSSRYISKNTYSWTNISCITTAGSEGYMTFSYSNYVVDVVTTSYFRNCFLVDLTQMFGAGNEPDTVEEVRAILPKDYYAYNEGELISAGVKKVETVGFNLWDEEWEVGSYNAQGQKVDNPNFARCKNAIPVIQGTTYYWNCYTTGVMFFYDGEDNCLTDISNVDWLTKTQHTIDDSRICYIRFRLSSAYGATYKNDICINKSQPNTSITPHNGQYLPYKGSATLIPTAIQTLPGYGWSAGNVYNEVDYANKKYIQRVGSVNLGSLTWAYQSNFQRFLTTGINDVCKPSATEYAYANITCAPYSTVGVYNTSLSAYNKSVAINTGGSLLIRDESYTDAASFKSAMSGVYLRYELATPVEIDISDMLEEGFLEAMEVESGGSVTFVSDTEDKYRLPVPNTNEYVVKLSEV